MEIKKEQFRKDLGDFFQLSGLLQVKKISHTPFIVIEDDVLSLCFSADLLVATYKPESEVIVQWSGKWRSDFFYMTVGDVGQALQRYKASGESNA